MNRILEITHEFHDIVVTSRTQFFPSEVEEPHTTGYISFGDSNDRKNFQKLYLSVFSNEDIKKYLRKRIPFYKFKRYRRALNITRKSPSLVVRPMLLSHIEDLIDSKRNFTYTYQIYQELIDRWVEREALKPGIEEKFGKGKYGSILKEFSQELAVDVYLNKELRGGYFITSANQFGKNIKLNKELLGNLSLSETERRSRSLLNRDADGNYKFSHKSILEYFLASRLISDKNFLNSFNFQGNDSAELFYKEMIVNEILAPVDEKIKNEINEKEDVKTDLSLFQLKKKKTLFKYAFQYQRKYSKLTWKIFEGNVEFKSGIREFDNLYRIYLYNKIIESISIDLKWSSFNLKNLLFYLDDNSLKELETTLRNSEKFYLKEKMIDNFISNLDYSSVEELSEPEADRVVLYSRNILRAIEITSKCLNNDKNSRLLLNNIENLIHVKNIASDENKQKRIEHLIGLTYDIYNRRLDSDFQRKLPMIFFPFYRLFEIALIEIMRNRYKRK